MDIGLSELVVSCFSTASRLLPALLLIVLLSRLAISNGQSRIAVVAGLLRRISPLPVFLLSYVVIIVVNRLTLATIELGLEPPLWFALPLGDGHASLVKWGLEVTILTVGDGGFFLGSERIKTAFCEVQQRTYIHVARVNSPGTQHAVARGLTVPTVLLCVELIPLLLGSSMVLETVFVEPGLGLWVINRIELRDFVSPVVMFTVILVLISLVTWSVEQLWSV